MSEVVFANPQLQRFASCAPPRPFKRLLYGALLELAAWLMIPLMFSLAILLTAFITAIANSMYVVRGGALFTIILLVLYLLGFVPFWVLLSVRVVRRLRRLGRRYRLNARGRLTWDKRPPVLYLRSFSEDYDDDPYRRDMRTPEEILTRALETAGPFVAIGKPGERLPLLGATRIYLPAGSWQEGVRHLMRVAQLVVIQPDISSGLLWETEAARGTVRPERLLISLLAWGRQDALTRRRLYETFRRNAGDLLPGPLPPELGRASFVMFGEDGAARLIAVSRWKRLLLCGSLIPTIRESLRPHLTRAGVRLGRRHRVIYLANVALLLWLMWGFILAVIGAVELWGWFGMIGYSLTVSFIVTRPSTPTSSCSSSTPPCGSRPAARGGC